MKKLLLTLAAFFAVSPIFADVRPVPLPEGEPASGFWALSADDQEVGVYTARTADPPFERYDYGGEYAFASLDADSPVRLKIRNLYGASLKNLTIRPQSLGLKPENVGDDSFELVVPKSCRFSVETNGREHPLLVFVNPPERDVPAADAENVVYYGPGVHDVGKIALGSNQTLYLAAGALVKGGIDACGENIKIRGRGVLDSTPWEWPKGPTGHVVHMHESKNVSIEGIIVRGASHWTIVPVNCDGVSIENIKLCGGRVQNDDGINPCNSRDVSVKNCFIRTDDDCMALKGLENSYGNCENIRVEGCVFWCDRARIVLMGHESRADYMRNIEYKDCDVIHSQTRHFLLEPGEKMRLENVVFDNIRFETGVEIALPEELRGKDLDVSQLRFDIDTANKESWLFIGRPVVNRYMRTQEPGHIKNVVIRNITADGLPSYCGILFGGADEEHRTEGLTIENVKVFGQKLDAKSPTIHIGDFIDDVEIK